MISEVQDYLSLYDGGLKQERAQRSQRVRRGQVEDTSQLISFSERRHVQRAESSHFGRSSDLPFLSSVPPSCPECSTARTDAFCRETL